MTNMLAILWISCLLIVLSDGKVYYVTCGSCVTNSTNSFGNCQVTVVPGEIYPGLNETTATRPKLVNHSWYTFQKDKKSLGLALNVTWSHTGAYFSKVQGYLMSITRTASDGSDFRRVNVHFPGNKMTSTDKIIMNYPCFGRDFGRSIDPDHSYSIKLRSLPAYHENTDHRINEVNAEIYIDCDDKRISHILDCLPDYLRYSDYYSPDYGSFENEPEATTTTTPSQKIGVATSSIISGLIAAVTIFAVVTIIFVIIWQIKNNNFLGFDKKSSILLLISTFDKEDDQDHQYLKAADMLCDILKQLGAVDVITNIWNDVNISEPLEWFDENVKNCKHIVLVCTPLGKKNWMKKNMNDMFVMGYQMYRKQRIKKRWFSSSSHKFSLICFDENSTVCIPDEFNQHKIKSTYILNNMNLLFSNLTGKKLNISLESVMEFTKALESLNSSAISPNSCLLDTRRTKYSNNNENLQCNV